MRLHDAADPGERREVFGSGDDLEVASHRAKAEDSERLTGQLVHVPVGGEDMARDEAVREGVSGDRLWLPTHQTPEPGLLHLGEHAGREEGLRGVLQLLARLRAVELLVARPDLD